MITVSDKKDCCGCGACAQRCPKQCIDLREDNEGFLYPQIDKKNCINCGLCEKVCPIINDTVSKRPLDVVAAKNNDEEKRMESSSGGVFIAVAEKIIERGGVVFGCAFDRHWEPHHISVSTMQDLHLLMKSKYVQSRTENTYCQVENLLKQNTEVLYTGTPCQVKGLYKFLRKEYTNLITMDFLCHGVPSPGVWRKYLLEASRHQTVCNNTAGKNTVLLSQKDRPIIDGISFRDKRLNGWKKFGFVLCQKSPSGDKNSVLSCIMTENPYLNSFFADLNLRPSCYECKCKNGRSLSDLTIGDFWGCTYTMPELDDDKGTSIVLINTRKGMDALHELPVTTWKVPYKYVCVWNNGLSEHIKPHYNRRYFFKKWQKTDDLIQLINNSLQEPFIRKAKNKIKKLLKRI